MTIKQQGGIFGRNPSFNDVEANKADIDNIQIDGNTISSTDTNGDVNIDPDGSGRLKINSGVVVNEDGADVDFRVEGDTEPNLIRTVASTNRVAIYNDAPKAALHIGDEGSALELPSGADGTWMTIRHAGYVGSSTEYYAGIQLSGGYGNSTSDPGEGGGYNIYARRYGASAGSPRTDLIFSRTLPYTDIEVETARFNTNGNLAFPSGQGIDFSATSGTGTSELFDDYEEGTWTPTLVTGTVTAADAVYTKIGNMVYARATLFSFSDRTTATNVIVRGLPFAPAVTSSGGSMFSRYTAVATPTPEIAVGDYVTFYGNSSGNYVQLKHSNLSASSSAAINFNLVYRA